MSTKALREAVMKERRLGQCSSREKMNTNMNLARVTTKSKSEMQTVSNGSVSQGEEMEVSRSVPMSRPRRVSKIEAK